MVRHGIGISLFFVSRRSGRLMALVLFLLAAAAAPAGAQNQASKAVAEQVIERIVNGRDLAAADKLIGPGLVQHISPAIAPGLETYKKTYAKLFKRYKSYRFDVDHSVAEGNLVALYGRLHGETKGGNKINFQVMELYRIENGKVVERWHVRQLIEN